MILNHPRSRVLPVSGQPSGLTAQRASALILGWGVLDEGENQASDGRREGRGTASEKFYWRPIARSQGVQCAGLFTWFPSGAAADNAERLYAVCQKAANPPL